MFLFPPLFEGNLSVISLICYQLYSDKIINIILINCFQVLYFYSRQYWSGQNSVICSEFDLIGLTYKLLFKGGEVTPGSCLIVFPLIMCSTTTQLVAFFFSCWGAENMYVMLAQQQTAAQITSLSARLIPSSFYCSPRPCLVNFTHDFREENLACMEY